MNFEKRLKYIFIHIRKIGFVSTIDYFLQRLLKSKDMLIKLNIGSLPHSIFLRNKTYDVFIFYQIFIKEDLLFDYKPPVSTILDCGANIGLATLYYQKKFPGARIISIEPENDNYELLLRNTKDYSNIITLKTGVFSEDCDLNVVDIGEGEASYRIMRNPGPWKIIQTVKCRSINSIMKEFLFPEIDILKMDIEGSEKECLFANDIEWLQKTKHFLLEIHENIHPGITNKILELIPSSSKISTHGEYTIIENNLTKSL